MCVAIQKHIENLNKFGVPVVVAINQFKSDTQAELETVASLVRGAGAEGISTSSTTSIYRLPRFCSHSLRMIRLDVAICNHWALGGAGARDLAEKVAVACAKSRAGPSQFRFLYPLDLSIKEKIETIAKEIYGADGVEYSEEAERKIQRYTEQVRSP